MTVEEKIELIKNNKSVLSNMINMASIDPVFETVETEGQKETTLYCVFGENCSWASPPRVKYFGVKWQLGYNDEYNTDVMHIVSHYMESGLDIINEIITKHSETSKWVNMKWIKNPFIPIPE